MMTATAIEKRRRYSGYRPSGVEWLGEIPAEWQEKRLRFCVRINPTKAETRSLHGSTLVSFVPMEAVGEYGGLRLDQTKPIDEVATGYTFFQDGDVVIAKITPCFENGKGAIAEGLENGIGFGTTELHVLRPSVRLERRYLFYLTISHAFRNFGAAYMYGAGGQKRIPDDFIRDFRHPIPTLEEQRAIAAFLDRETARIDALISKKERQIELLQEKRTALISHVVTKGLNPDVKLKPSGIEWIGEIPEHWEVNRLRHALQSISNGTTETQVDFETEFPVTRIESISKGTINYCNIGFVQGNNQIANYFLKYGDILFSHINSFEMVGNCAFYRGERPLCVGMNLLRLRSKEDVYPEFLLSWLKSKIFIHAVRMVSKHAINQVSVPTSLIKDLPFISPSFSEQHAIAAFLDRETARIDALIMKIGDSIEKLREYRTALISAAVTGKINVLKARHD